MRRRDLMLCACAGFVGTVPRAWAQAGPEWRPFMNLAFEMRRRAAAAGDQPYGAVVVRDMKVVAASPSRVITARNADAHAEREAIREAREKAGTADLAGAVLVSSSRPCGPCERAAFAARIARMIHGEQLHDAGPPQA